MFHCKFSLFQNSDKNFWAVTFYLFLNGVKVYFSLNQKHCSFTCHVWLEGQELDRWSLQLQYYSKIDKKEQGRVCNFISHNAKSPFHLEFKYGTVYSCQI